LGRDLAGLRRRRQAGDRQQRRRTRVARHRHTRKNFLFLGSEAGGERAAILYTVLESAKLNGLDPEAYLANVIDRMAKGHPINRLGELLPWNWPGQAAKMAA
jgi:transposase